MIPVEQLKVSKLCVVVSWHFFDLMLELYALFLTIVRADVHLVLCAVDGSAER
jgi:hypothetical protein